MKALKHILIWSGITFLSACGPSGYWSGMQTEYLENDIGMLAECNSNPPINPATGRPALFGVRKSQAEFFWRDNNLPKGTLYYVCEGDTAVLPKDCNGNPLTTPEIRRYWKKHNLPIGIEEFDCSTGVPQVPKDSWFYKKGYLSYPSD